jgi:hypothetical protein
MGVAAFSPYLKSIGRAMAVLAFLCFAFYPLLAE